MSIYWRNGWAHARKTIKGIEHRKALETKSKREAESAYQRWVAALEVERSGSGPTRSTSFVAAVNNFTEHHLGNLKKSSQVRYLQSLLILAGAFEGKTLQEISKSDLAMFVSDRRKSPIRKTKLSDATIIRDLQCLSSVFTVAIDFDLTDVNPVAAFLKTHSRRKTLRNSDPRTRYLTHVEELRVLDQAVWRAGNPDAIRRAEKAMIAAAIAFGIDTGFRAQELLRARRSWLSPGLDEITVPGDYAKSGKPRSVPLLPRARRIAAMLPVNPNTDLLFWRCDSGKPFADLNKALQTIAASVGVTGIEFHDLRRTCGTRLLQDHRMRMAEVSAWLGHASVAQTETTYAFLKVENLHDAIGGRVLDKTARLRLEDMFLMQFGDLTGTIDGTGRILAIETTAENAN